MSGSKEAALSTLLCDCAHRGLKHSHPLKATIYCPHCQWTRQDDSYLSFGSHLPD